MNRIFNFSALIVLLMACHSAPAYAISSESFMMDIMGWGKVKLGTRTFTTVRNGSTVEYRNVSRVINFKAEKYEPDESLLVYRNGKPVHYQRTKNGTVICDAVIKNNFFKDRISGRKVEFSDRTFITEFFWVYLKELPFGKSDAKPYYLLDTRKELQRVRYAGVGYWKPRKKKIHGKRLRCHLFTTTLDNPKGDCYYFNDNHEFVALGNVLFRTDRIWVSSEVLILLSERAENSKELLLCQKETVKDVQRFFALNILPYKNLDKQNFYTFESPYDFISADMIMHGNLIERFSISFDLKGMAKDDIEVFYRSCLEHLGAGMKVDKNNTFKYYHTLSKTQTKVRKQKRCAYKISVTRSGDSITVLLNLDVKQGGI
jgi:hypothetical protein